MGLKKPEKFEIVTTKNVLTSFKILSLGIAYIFMWVFYWCYIVFKILMDMSIKIFEVLGDYGNERKQKRIDKKQHKRDKERGYSNY